MKIPNLTLLSLTFGKTWKIDFEFFKDTLTKLSKLKHLSLTFVKAIFTPRKLDNLATGLKYLVDINTLNIAFDEMDDITDDHIANFFKSLKNHEFDTLSITGLDYKRKKG